MIHNVNVLNCINGMYWNISTLGKDAGHLCQLLISAYRYRKQEKKGRKTMKDPLMN